MRIWLKQPRPARCTSIKPRRAGSLTSKARSAEKACVYAHTPSARWPVSLRWPRSRQRTRRQPLQRAAGAQRVTVRTRSETRSAVADCSGPCVRPPPRAPLLRPSLYAPPAPLRSSPLLAAALFPAVLVRCRGVALNLRYVAAQSWALSHNLLAAWGRLSHSGAAFVGLESRRVHPRGAQVLTLRKHPQCGAGDVHLSRCGRGCSLAAALATPSRQRWRLRSRFGSARARCARAHHAL